jgi:uncharacterized protein (TIGR00251 family)
MSDELIETRDDGTFDVRVHAQPGAGRTAVAGRHGDALKLRVAAPPEGGRANEALGKLLADTFGVSGSKVTLISGETSRRKVFRIAGVDVDEAKRLLSRTLETAEGPGNVTRQADIGRRRQR